MLLMIAAPPKLHKLHGVTLCEHVAFSRSFEERRCGEFHRGGYPGAAATGCTGRLLAHRLARLSVHFLVAQRHCESAREVQGIRRCWS